MDPLGTILLDELVAKATQEIDFFVLYSSITSVLGNSGQTAYAAANAFMNSFADYGLKIRGKPYISVCWGAMGGSGMLARNTNVASLLEKSGLHLLDIPTGEIMSCRYLQLKGNMLNFLIFQSSLLGFFCKIWNRINVKSKYIFDPMITCKMF